MTTPAQAHRHKLGVETTGSRLEVQGLGGASVIVLGDQPLTTRKDVDAFIGLINHAITQAGDPIIILDFRRVKAIGSILLGELVAMHKAMTSEGKQLRLAALNDEASKVLAITNLNRMIPVFPDLKSAIAARQSRRKKWWPFGN